MLSRKFLIILVAVFSFNTRLFAQKADASYPTQEIEDNISEKKIDVLTLAEAIKIALQKNLILRAANNAVRSADWGVKKAVFDFFPKVDFELQYTRLDKETVDRGNAFFDFVNDPNGDGFLPEAIRSTVRPAAFRDGFGPTFRVTQPIYNGGFLSSQLGVARAENSRNKASLEETRQQVILDTQTNYFQILKAQELLVLAEETVHSNQRHLDATQKMVNIGLRSRSDMLRFEVQLANSENDLVIAQNNLELARLTLNHVLGVDLDQYFELQPIEKYTWQQLPGANEELTHFVKNHPEFQVIRSNVSGQQAVAGIARSGLLPKVNLAYRYSWEANNTIAFDSFTNWSLGVTASIPIFNSFQNYAQWQKEREALKEINKLKDNVERLLELQIRRATLRVKAAEKRIAITRKAVKEASENMRIINKSYDVGLVSSLDIVDVQVAMTQAMTTQIEARYDYFLARSFLTKAMGILGR